MVRLSERVRKFFGTKRGATMVEYGLLLALIAIIVMVGAGIVGKNANQVFTTVSGKLK